MSQSQDHLIAVLVLLEGLGMHLSREEDTLLSDVPIYYQEGDNTKFVSPDVYLKKGHVMAGKRTYRVWEEGRVPDLAVETVSRSNTRQELEEDNRNLYARMGISEYFVFEMRPTGRRPALIRFRLNTETGTTERKESWGKPLRSEMLDTELCPDGERLRLIDPETQSPYRGGDEERRQRKAAEARAELFKSKLANKDRENQILKQQLTEMRETARLRRRRGPER